MLHGSRLLSTCQAGEILYSARRKLRFFSVQSNNCKIYNAYTTETSILKPNECPILGYFKELKVMRVKCRLFLSCGRGTLHRVQYKSQLRFLKCPIIRNPPMHKCLSEISVFSDRARGILIR